MPEEKQSKSKKWYQQWWFFVIVVFLILVAIGSINNTDKQKNQSASVEQNSKNINPVNQQAKDDTYKTRLQKEIDSVTNFDSKKYKDTVDNILIEAALFSEWAKMINESKNYNNDEINRMAENFRSKLSNLQVREFPLLRKAYGDTTNKALWIEDGKARVSGASSKTYEMESTLFASNKAVAQMHASLEKTLMALRFTRVNYLWSQYAEYTYFPIESPEDSEIVEIKL